MIVHSDTNFSNSYLNHPVFDEITKICNYYEGLSYTCYSFIPSGVPILANYASYIYSSILGTLESIKTLLRIGHINDSYNLLRALFDTMLTEIYIDIVRKEKYNVFENFFVKDVDDWLKARYRIPSIKKILKILKTSSYTKEIYPFFSWDTNLKKIREILDDSVHVNSYNLLIYNCKDLYLENREEHLNKIQIILRQIVTVHIAFIFHMNPHYMMSSDYTDYLDAGETPPADSETWLAPYAQEAFDLYIKPHKFLADFIKNTCGMRIE